MFPVKTFKNGFRKDGWPFCPNCGADELYLDSGLYLKCYFCYWSEGAPNKAIDSDPKHDADG
jgi:hypothetical protein